MIPRRESILDFKKLE
ncbi:unnamed protein product, partial [Allacma fusca]